MGATTSIEWTDATWNPVGGCSLASPGCTNCYAQRMAGTRLKSHPLYGGTTTMAKTGPVFNGTLTAAPDDHPVWTWPLRWRGSPQAKAESRRSRIFVGDMSDLFHEARPDAVIDRVFAVMALCPQFDFQVLTKRAARMRAYLSEASGRIADAVQPLRTDRHAVGPLPHLDGGERWFPLANVWLGVSAEDQRRADERIPDLLATPAVVRFVSAEPLLGQSDFTQIGKPLGQQGTVNALTGEWASLPIFSAGGRAFLRTGVPDAKLDWIIVGGESGPHARPMHPDWVRSIRDQAEATDTAFFFKQWGEWAPVYDRQVDDPDWRRCDEVERQTPAGRWLNIEGGQGFHGGRVVRMARIGKARAGRHLDGREWNGFPAARDVTAWRPAVPDEAPSSPGPGEGDHPKDGGRGSSGERFESSISPPTASGGPPSPDGEGCSSSVAADPVPERAPSSPAKAGEGDHAKRRGGGTP